jgi:hypothetical protein
MKSSDETEKEHYSALMEATLAAENEAQAYADRQDQRESKRGAIQAQELADARFAQALAAQDGNENVHDADVDAHEHSCTEEELEAEAAGPMNSCVAAEEKYWNNETTRADHDDSEHKHENERRKAQALADARFARALAAQDDKKNVHDVNVDVDAHEHSCTEEESEAEAAGPMNTFVAAENWNETRADHDSEHENERRKAQASADARLARALASQGRGRGQGVDVDTDDEDYAYTDEEVEAAQFQMCCYGVRNDSSAEDRMVEKVGPRREDIVVHLIDCHPELKKGIGFVRTGWQVAVNAATREGACSWRQPKTKYRGSIITTMERSELRDKVDNAKRENTITQNAAEDVDPLGKCYSNQGCVDIWNQFLRLERRSHTAGIAGGYTKRRATVIDAFCGIGSGLVCLKRLGISLKSVISIEHDQVAHRVFEHHHNSTRDEGVTYRSLDRFEELEDRLDEFLQEYGRKLAMSLTALLCPSLETRFLITKCCTSLTSLRPCFSCRHYHWWTTLHGLFQD